AKRSIMLPNSRRWTSHRVNLPPATSCGSLQPMVVAGPWPSAPDGGVVSAIMSSSFEERNLRRRYRPQRTSALRPIKNAGREAALRASAGGDRRVAPVVVEAALGLAAEPAGLD